MRVPPLTAALILSASSAVAQTYGTDDGGCDLYSTGAKVGESAVYFDGMRLSALNWECELTPAAGDAYVGLCTGEGGDQRRPQESGQDDKWSFCLTLGTLCPVNQEIP